MSYAYTIKLDRISGEVEQAGTWQANLMQILPPEDARSFSRSTYVYRLAARGGPDLHRT